MKPVELTEEQEEQMINLWYIYGNNGKKHTLANHRFIQMLIEKHKDYRYFYKPTAECLKAVDAILKPEEGKDAAPLL